MLRVAWGIGEWGITKQTYGTKTIAALAALGASILLDVSQISSLRVSVSYSVPIFSSMGVIVAHDCGEDPARWTWNANHDFVVIHVQD